MCYQVPKCLAKLPVCVSCQLTPKLAVVMAVAMAVVLGGNGLVGMPSAQAQSFSASGVDMRDVQGQASQCRGPAVNLRNEALRLRQEIRDILACNAQGQFFTENGCRDAVFTDHNFTTDSAGDTLQFLNDDGSAASETGVIGGADGADLTCVTVGPWEIGDWGSCSAACDSTGTRSRSVSCDFYRCISPSRERPISSKGCVGPPCPPPPPEPSPSPGPSPGPTPGPTPTPEPSPGPAPEPPTPGPTPTPEPSPGPTPGPTPEPSPGPAPEPPTPEPDPGPEPEPTPGPTPGPEPEPDQDVGGWTAGSWGACSKPCGGGTRTRPVTCNHDWCTGFKPTSSQSCNTQSCSTSSGGGGGGCPPGQSLATLPNKAGGGTECQVSPGDGGGQ